MGLFFWPRTALCCEARDGNEQYSHRSPNSSSQSDIDSNRCAYAVSQRMGRNSIRTEAPIAQASLMLIATVVLMLRGHGQIYCSSTIAPALFSALTPVSPYLLHPCSRTYGRPALMQYLHISHPWRKWQRAVFAQIAD